MMLAPIPFDQPNGIPFVVMEARIGDDLPARVLLDTGTAAPFQLVLSPAMAERAGAVAEPEEAVASSGAIGDAAVAFRPARLARFSLGPVSLRDVRAGISPAVDAVARQLGMPVDAIVGHHFVAGRTIAIDYVRHEVDFAAAPGPAAAATPFALAPGRPLTLVRVLINGRGPFTFVLDTGASITLLSPATAAAAGVAPGEVARLGGAGGAAMGGARIGRANLTLGGLSRDGQPVAVADVIGPVAAAAEAPLDGVLGADFFRSGRIILDYGGNRLWFEEAEAR